MADGNVDKIRKMCKNLNLSEGKITDEYLFTLDAVDLFYYKNNIGQRDIKSGFVDGPNDGGIDFIYSDSESMSLIQGKSSENLSVEDIKNIYNKMYETVLNFDDKKYEKYSKALVSAYLNAYDEMGDGSNIEFVIFTRTKLSNENRKEIGEYCENPPLNNFTLQLLDISDIEKKRAILFQQQGLIPEDFISLCEPKNMLKYGDNGIIVNINATSLKRLYDKYSSIGLFSYNLREHISQKSVDDGIDKTIKEEREKFWFYNNGITIGCEDYIPDGTKLKLYNFSIINGAQTTTKIGQSKIIRDDHDFALVCKVVRAKNSFEEDGDFIGKISEASNSQKPIKPRDIKANAIEQKLLQQKSACNKLPLSIEIKRGVRPKNYKKVEKWQRVSNEYIAQLIYACIFQKPGAARNSKNKIFSTERIYNQIFRRSHDYNTLYDLVYLGEKYNNFADDYVAQTNDVNRIAAVKNGKYIVLAVALYMYKKETGILNDASSDQLHKDNISGLLISNYPDDDLDKRLNALFGFIIRQVSSLYEKKQQSLKLTSFSNFFKQEYFYDEVILREFDNLDTYDQEKLSSFMTVFTKKK